MQEVGAKGGGAVVFEHPPRPRACILLVTDLFSFILIATLWAKYDDPHFTRGKLWFREGTELVQGHTVVRSRAQLDSTLPHYKAYAPPSLPDGLE